MTTTITVGNPTVVESHSESSHFAVVFEDDGDTGYFYGVTVTEGVPTILDALHVYNVQSVVDRGSTYPLEIVWAPEGHAAALLIEGYPHAVVDFARQRAACRTGFPPTSNWSREGHAWDDRLVAFLPRAS